jgi:glycosyltransferase involved in cell wall biosynthesis
MSADARGRLLIVEQGGRGGVADYTGELARAMAALGWTVTLATAADHRFDLGADVTVHGLFHYLRDDTPLRRALRRLRLGPVVNGLRFMAAMPRLMALSREADVVHTQSWEIPEIGLVAFVCLRLAGAVVVETLHGTVERSGRLKRTRQLVTLASAKLTARTIVHTQADLVRMPKGALGRTVVIAHGDYGALARSGGEVSRESSRAALGIDPDVPVTLLFGQLRADKGLGDLLAAAARVSDLHVLVGGQDLGALAHEQRRLEDPELAARVTVREGFLEMDEVARLFAAADTVVLPYRVASQSGVLLLAYGFSRPVIVYPAGGLPEAVIDGQTGWICERADVDALSAALAASVQAGAQECARRGRRGAELADERYSWRVIAERTSGLYEEALGRV